MHIIPLMLLLISKMEGSPYVELQMGRRAYKNNNTFEECSWHSNYALMDSHFANQ